MKEAVGSFVDLTGKPGPFGNPSLGRPGQRQDYRNGRAHLRTGPRQSQNVLPVGQSLVPRSTLLEVLAETCRRFQKKGILNPEHVRADGLGDSWHSDPGLPECGAVPPGSGRHKDRPPSRPTRLGGLGVRVPSTHWNHATSRAEGSEPAGGVFKIVVSWSDPALTFGVTGRRRVQEPWSRKATSRWGNGRFVPRSMRSKMGKRFATSNPE